MKGSDLRCWKCGEKARDVAMDLELDSFFRSPTASYGSIFWTCVGGHPNETGSSVRTTKPGGH